MKELLADVCPVCGEKLDQKQLTVFIKLLESTFHYNCWTIYKLTHPDWHKDPKEEIVQWG